ncbi:hypothetical protein GCM10007420_02750 [Glycocaulis albus]|uniref:Uncharacterized protein n=1 Tax=Glycocaulis albus TaxID=1382801 RepID=A0ABQ1XGH8_9PROT|nr:hypothetical protein GCM10007420_02750 [Glycocaulis albus]
MPLRGAADFAPDGVEPSLWREAPRQPSLLARNQIRYAPASGYKPRASFSKESERTKVRSGARNLNAGAA